MQGLGAGLVSSCTSTSSMRSRYPAESTPPAERVVSSAAAVRRSLPRRRACTSEARCTEGPIRDESAAARPLPRPGAGHAGPGPGRHPPRHVVQQRLAELRMALGESRSRRWCDGAGSRCLAAPAPACCSVRASTGRPVCRSWGGTARRGRRSSIRRAAIQDLARELVGERARAWPGPGARWSRRPGPAPARPRGVRRHPVFSAGRRDRRLILDLGQLVHQLGENPKAERRSSMSSARRSGVIESSIAQRPPLSPRRASRGAVDVRRALR